ncbi:DUF302 domain-containing protein [Trinickia soli]|uniref:ABC transporter ATP-binding protein n=1 Tax=Trinickia soli TaxID=380675 RepID=A0A2N7W091_9BURK|nr:DUF302 domain-containing protein [Trinickia soli]KAA0090021.1 DUF302 domain-containing protein [Paraburkholderia sp. T12-10]PMS22828.1 ABC transporter ATP-binding protein [Trinickia soli]CAB3684288.1 hypothetical protein LMG24076_02596 [Trinickia soli]
MSKSYGFGKTVTCSFDEATERVKRALADEGFGILSDIDVAETLKKKLGETMPAYRIFGACNPALAHRALQAEPEIGLLLPCNIVTREDAAGVVHIDVIEPTVMFELVENPDLAKLATEVSERLKRALNAI